MEETILKSDQKPIPVANLMLVDGEKHEIASAENQRCFGTFVLHLLTKQHKKICSHITKFHMTQ